MSKFSPLRSLFLIQNLQATVCIEYETKRLDLCCRVNADDPGRESIAVEYLWAHLSIFIVTVQRFLTAWPGLFFKVINQTILLQLVSSPIHSSALIIYLQRSDVISRLANMCSSKLKTSHIQLATLFMPPQTSLVPFGLALYGGDVIVSERSFAILHLLQVAKSHGHVRFIDDHKDRQLDVKLLIPGNGI